MANAAFLYRPQKFAACIGIGIIYDMITKLADERFCRIFEKIGVKEIDRLVRLERREHGIDIWKFTRHRFEGD